MTAKNLIRQLEFLLENGYIEETDEIVILGSGDRESGHLEMGLCMPKVEIGIDSHVSGYYGLGITSSTKEKEIQDWKKMMETYPGI